MSREEMTSDFNRKCLHEPNETPWWYLDDHYDMFRLQF